MASFKVRLVGGGGGRGGLKLPLLKAVRIPDLAWRKPVALLFYMHDSDHQVCLYDAFSIKAKTTRYCVVLPRYILDFPELADFVIVLVR